MVFADFSEASLVLDCVRILHSDICSTLDNQLRSPEYLPAKFGIPDYCGDTSNNITRGALEVLFSLLPQSPPSIDLIASLKQPFDTEVISMNASSASKARKFIHDYLTVSIYRSERDKTSQPRLGITD